jgi:hypothetical protein
VSRIGVVVLSKLSPTFFLCEQRCLGSAHRCLRRFYEQEFVARDNGRRLSQEQTTGCPTTLIKVYGVRKKHRRISCRPPTQGLGNRPAIIFIEGALANLMPQAGAILCSGRAIWRHSNSATFTKCIVDPEMLSRRRLTQFRYPGSTLGLL